MLLLSPTSDNNGDGINGNTNGNTEGNISDIDAPKPTMRKLVPVGAGSSAMGGGAKRRGSFLTAGTVTSKFKGQLARCVYCIYVYAV